MKPEFKTSPAKKRKRKKDVSRSEHITLKFQVSKLGWDVAQSVRELA
jgi:hypothetical protein